MKKQYLLVDDYKTIKKGDNFKIDTNPLFIYTVLDVKKWNNEIILYVRPNDKGFNDNRHVITTTGTKIYKER